MGKHISENSPKQRYIEQLLCQKDIPALTHIQQSIDNNNLPQININAYEGQLMRTLLAAANAKNIVEIGTHAGFSAYFLATATENSTVHTFEKSPDTAKIAAANFAHLGLTNIKQYVGDAHQNLKTISKPNFYDAIFIDADKNGYPAYLDWADANLRKGGLIIADNTFLFGNVYGEGADQPAPQKMIDNIDGFNRRLHNRDRYEAIMISTIEGQTVAVKKF